MAVETFSENLNSFVKEDRKMSKLKTTSATFVIVAIAVILSGNLYAGGKGATPNGKPYLEINGYIHEIEGEISTIQDQIDSIVAKVDTIEERVGADESAIADLQATNAVLQAQIDANATDVATLEESISTLESENSDLQSQVDKLGDDNGTLQAQIDANTTLITTYKQSLDTLQGDLLAHIDNNNSLIAALQAEIEQINAALELKQNIVSGTCPAGYSIREILEDGSVICEADDFSATVLSRNRSNNSVTVMPNSINEIWASCPTGHITSGGGFYAYGLNVYASLPTKHSGTFVWKAVAYNPNSYSIDLNVYAICIQLAP